MNLILEIQKKKDLSPAERQIATYISENLEEVTSLRVKDLAERTYTSSSTVLRFIKKVGFTSYIDFRIQLAKDVFDYLKQKVLLAEEKPVEFENSTDSIINNVTANNIFALKKTIDLNKESTFNDVVEVIKKHPTIDYYGIGHSAVIAKDAVIKSLRLGIHATFYEDKGTQLLASKTEGSNRLGVLISYTGETDVMIEIAKNLMKTGTPTISFTSNVDNTLSDLCNYNFFIDTTESVYTLGHMSSRMAFLNVFDILFNVYANEDYSKNMEMLQKTYTYK